MYRYNFHKTRIQLWNPHRFKAYTFTQLSNAIKNNNENKLSSVLINLGEMGKYLLIFSGSYITKCFILGMYKHTAQIIGYCLCQNTKYTKTLLLLMIRHQFANIAVMKKN